MALDILAPTPEAVREQRAALRQEETLHADLLGREVPVAATPEGLRATSKGRPIEPRGVERYLASKLGSAHEPVRDAMTALAESMPPQELARRAFDLCTQFRPRVPAGEQGWGTAGVLDIRAISRLATRP